MVLCGVGLWIEHVQNTAWLGGGPRVMVGRIGLTVARTSSSYFVWAASWCSIGSTRGRLFRRIELLGSLEAGSTADRAAEAVDVGVICVLHRLFVSARCEDWVEFVGGFEACVTADRTTMLVRRVGAMLVFVWRLVPRIIGIMRPGKVSCAYTRLALGIIWYIEERGVACDSNIDLHSDQSYQCRRQFHQSTLSARETIYDDLAR
jgi:hypothetical protein